MRSGEQLCSDIAHLLETAKGDLFLKRLFWEVLGFDPANNPAPPGIVPANLAGDVHSAQVIARWDPVIVVHVRFAASSPLAQDEQPIILRACRKWDDVVVVFSNYGETEWDICRATADGKLARIALDRELHTVQEMATALARLRTFDLTTGDDLAGMQTSAGADRALASPRRLLDRRLKRKEKESGLFRSVSLYPMRPSADQIEWGRKWRQIGDRGAREQLICTNIRLALHWVKKKCRVHNDFDDLAQEACIGLMRAADKFEPERGFKFTTYASWWVCQRIARGRLQHGSLIQIPWYLIDALRTISRGKTPTHLDGTPIKESCLAAARIALATKNNTEQVTSLVVDESEMERARCAELAEHLRWAIGRLEDKRLQEIIELRYGLNGGIPLTLEEVGKIFELTRERIRQLEEKALERIRRIFSQEKWDWNDPQRRIGARSRFKLTSDPITEVDDKPVTSRVLPRRKTKSASPPSLWQEK